MSRTKTVSDDVVFLAIRQLLASGGEKAVSFASVARATGLAGPTLVQRFGSRADMMHAAQMAAWDALDTATAKAVFEADLSPKGGHNLLKSLTTGVVDPALLATDFREPLLRRRAADWRQRLEGALALQMGGGAKGREAAALLFAAWQGQMLWQIAGGKSFRIKDAMKRLT